MTRRNPYYNDSGCPDPTAYEALKPIIQEDAALEKKVHNLIMEIKKVEYDDMECLATEDYAVCPYCGYKNYIEPECYLGQDEEGFEVCGECERTFVHQINYRVTFTSEPLENYYLDEKKRKLKRIKDLEEKNKRW